MYKAFRLTVSKGAIGIAAFSLAVPANAGNGSEVGAGFVGFGIGAVVGSALAPQQVYVAHHHLLITRHRRPSLKRHRRQFMSGRSSMGARHIATIAANDTMREVVRNIVTMNGNATSPAPTVGGPLAPACYRVSFFAGSLEVTARLKSTGQT